MGHNLEFEREAHIYVNANDPMPYKRYKVYQCSRCMATKRKKV